MSTVNAAATQYVDQSSNNTAANAFSPKDIGKDEFLKLLVTQLQNQDPMNPTDNQEFIAQIASFSSLEQLISINQSVTELANASRETGQSGNGSENSM